MLIIHIFLSIVSTPKICIQLVQERGWFDTNSGALDWISLVIACQILKTEADSD